MHNRTVSGLLLVVAVLLAADLLVTGSSSAKAERTRVGSEVIGFAVTQDQSGEHIKFWRLHGDGHVEVRSPGIPESLLRARSAGRAWTPLHKEEGLGETQN